jgi:hypothetical protein
MERYHENDRPQCGRKSLAPVELAHLSSTFANLSRATTVSVNDALPER